MKRARASASVHPLIDAVRPLEADGPLLSAVLSTYALSMDQPNFFEQDFLPALLGLGGIRDRGYAVPVMLERKLKDSYVALVCDAHALAASPRPSLQIDVFPFADRTQHGKVMVLQWQRRVRLVISSANLTHEGFRNQREIATVLDFTPDGELAGGLLADAIHDWLAVLGEVRDTALERNLAALADSIRGWGRHRASGSSLSVVFGGGAVPLWRRLVDAWPENEPLLEWRVCSPFWPDPEDSKSPFENIAAALQARSVRFEDTEITLIAAADVPGESGRPKFPFPLVRQLRESGFPVRRGKIRAARLDALPSEVPTGMAEDQRQLHAKWIMLRGPQTVLVLVGSANFTRAGLGTSTRLKAANIEACVLLRLAATEVDSDSWSPPLCKAVVDWASCSGDQLVDVEPEDLEQPLWPAFIARIEVSVEWLTGSEPQGRIRVGTLPPSHPAFAVRVMANREGTDPPPILSVEKGSDEHLIWHDAPLNANTLHAILAQRIVKISWEGADESVLFPVNIDEHSKSGLPSVLGARPDERQLLAYFHGRIAEEDLISLLIQHRGSKKYEGEGPASVERELQNYIVREFVESLFGLSRTLREAAGSQRGFEQALIGEFSPLCLAEQITRAFQSLRRTATATAFQLVELIRVVSTLELPDSLSKEERAALGEVRERAIARLIGFAELAARRPDFQAVCGDRHFQAYVRASLPANLNERWMTTISSAIVPEGVS